MSFITTYNGTDDLIKPINVKFHTKSSQRGMGIYISLEQVDGYFAEQ